LLEGEVMLRSQRGTRALKADEFQIDMLMTAREPDELIVAVRFPVAANPRGMAFREVARRHGDFAMIAIGAVVENNNTVRLGVGGMAGRPVVRKIATSKSSAIRDAVEALAMELEGYEDVHASANLRRDLLRRIGPVVIEEAIRCAA
jgi:2-furoyl-CoA dehydrogenase FAD binding subunit